MAESVGHGGHGSINGLGRADLEAEVRRLRAEVDSANEKAGAAEALAVSAARERDVLHMNLWRRQQPIDALVEAIAVARVPARERDRAAEGSVTRGEYTRALEREIKATLREHVGASREEIERITHDTTRDFEARHLLCDLCGSIEERGDDAGDPPAFCREACASCAALRPLATQALTTPSIDAEGALEVFADMLLEAGLLHPPKRRKRDGADASARARERMLGAARERAQNLTERGWRPNFYARPCEIIIDGVRVPFGFASIDRVDVTAEDVVRAVNASVAPVRASTGEDSVDALAYALSSLAPDRADREGLDRFAERVGMERRAAAPSTVTIEPRRVGPSSSITMPGPDFAPLRERYPWRVPTRVLHPHRRILKVIIGDDT